MFFNRKNPKIQKDLDALDILEKARRNKIHALGSDVSSQELALAKGEESEDFESYAGLNARL